MEVSPNIIEIKTNSDMHKYCSAITKHKATVIDTETTGLDPHVNKPILFQIGTDKIQYVIHWYRVSLEPLRKYLESGDILKIFQFHSFDYKFIKTHAHIEVDTNIFDTALAELVLKGGLEKLQGGVNLATLSLKYLDLPLDKSIRKLFEYWTPNIKIDRNMIEYSAYDLIAPYHIHSIQKKLLVANNLTATAQLEFDASSAIADMELNGMYLDSDMWAGLDVNATNNKIAAKDILDSYFHDVCNIDLFGKPLINYDSSEQLLDVLKKKGLPLPNTDARTLKMNRSHEIIPAVEEHRKWAKATSTYGIDFLKHINPVTKRVHTSYWQILATGRLSSEKPNLQNIISDIKYREPFRAQHEGESILTIDYAGCELRILAELSQDPVLLKAFGDELITDIEADPHSTIGTLMLGIPMSKTVNADKRKQMKSLNFGLCIAKGQLILTNKGLVPIEDIKLEHLLWDGEDWVTHEGVVYNGNKEVITYEGLTTTPDHIIWTEENKQISIREAASKLCRPKRTGNGTTAIRFGNTTCDKKHSNQRKRLYTRKMRLHLLWGSKNIQHEQPLVKKNNNMQMPKPCKIFRCTGKNTGCKIRHNSTKMQQGYTREFSPLQGAWYKKLIQLKRAFYKMGIGNISKFKFQGTSVRQNKQQWSLRTQQFTTNHLQYKLKKQITPVYDIINAGPNNRFTCQDILVHNCYGMGYNTLSVMLNVSIKEAKSLVKQYFKTLPGIKKYLDTSAANAIARGYSVTLGGRRRYFSIPKLQDLVDKLGYADGKEKYDKTIGYIERQGKNSPIQGTNGDIIKKALVELRHDIKKNQRKTKIINTVHDEVIFEGADMHEYMPIAINIMNAAQAHFLHGVPPRVSATNAPHWSK